MYFKTWLGEIIPKYIQLSKTEAKILGTMITMKSGNAYSLWKTSGLKHYPTVLRALKKLEEKRLVQIMSKMGVRGERTYTPTLIGTLVFYIFKGEEKKIVEMVEENSSLFREFSKIEKVDYLAFAAVQDIVLDVYRNREPRNFDEAIKERVEEHLMDPVINPLDDDNFEWLIKVSKVEWIRQLEIRLIEDEINRLEMNVEALKKLKEKLLK